MSISTETESVSQPSPLPRALASHFEDALVFAAQKHQRQTRKGTDIPYISHLVQVAGLALENGANEDEAVAALLHDVMEDQDVTQAELTQHFGPEVATIVAACSDSEGSDKAPWRQRKEAYIAHITDAPRSVRLVSACDKLHNARAILADYTELGEGLWSRFNATRPDILWYYQSLAHAFQQAEERHNEPPVRAVRELTAVVDELFTQVQQQSEFN